MSQPLGCPCVLRDVRVNLLQESYGNGIYNKPVGFLLGSEIGFALVDLLHTETRPRFSHQLIVETLAGSKVRHIESFGSPLRPTLAVYPLGSGLMFPSLPYRACPNYPSQAKLAVTFSGFSPILPRQRGRSWQCREAKGDNKVEYNILGLGGLGFFVLLTLLILHEIVNFGVFATPTSWGLVKFKKHPF